MRVVVCDHCGMVDILSQILLHRIRLEVYFVTHLGSTHTAIAIRKYVRRQEYLSKLLWLRNQGMMIFFTA